MVTKRQIENRFFPSVCCLTNETLGRRKLNRSQTRVTWPKWQILNIQDCGRATIWNWLHHSICMSPPRYWNSKYKSKEKTV